MHTMRGSSIDVPGLSLVLAGAGALALAGCGGATLPAGATNPSSSNSPIALSNCMRSHGVPNFPDATGGGLTVTQVVGGASMTIDGITFSGPAFQAAEKACKKYLPFGGGQPPSLTASQKRRILLRAQCMRTHGVPNFPDPTFPATGGPKAPPPARSGVNPESPAFKHAAQACGGAEIRISKGT